MTVTADGVLDEARKWLGYLESPGNITPFGEQSGFQGGEWCGMFTESMVKDAGGTVGEGGTIPRNYYCPSGVAAFNARGDFHTDPQPGDIVWYHNGKEWFHTGLVESVDEWPAAVTTIEGNTGTDAGINPAGGGVWRRRRVPGQYGYTFGFGRPRYDSATPAPPPPFIPPAEEDDMSEVITIVNSANQPTGQYYVYAGGVFAPAHDNSASTANGWHETRMSAKVFDELYSRHCRKNRLDPKTYTAA